MIENSRPSPFYFHGVRFHRGTDDLCSLVSAFVVEGITRAQPALVVATAEHRATIRNRLSPDVDVGQLEREGLLVFWDAAETLERLLVNNQLHRQLFEDTVSPVIRDISNNGSRTVRVYGELAELLWERDLTIAAGRLELYADALAKREGLLILCGYGAPRFLREGKAAAYVCNFHTHVLSRRWDETVVDPTFGRVAE